MICPAPLAPPTIFTLKACPRHCDGGGSKTGGQRSRAFTMPIPDSNRTASLRSCRTQRGHQFLIDDALDGGADPFPRSEEHTSELQSHLNLVCRLLLEKKKK